MYDNAVTIEHADEHNETVAQIEVQRFVRTVLYPTDTPKFKVNVDWSWSDGVGDTVMLTTDLPDDMLYIVTYEQKNAEPVLAAYRRQKPEDLKVHY